MAANDLFEGSCFDRNLIGGVWTFPRNHYELEIRSPVTSELLATVPFSSQADVADAAAAASAAIVSDWRSVDTRAEVLRRFVNLFQHRAFDVAARQAAEVGLSDEDSSVLVAAALELLRTLDTGSDREAGGVVEGHILGWGFPALEFVLAALPPLFTGSCLVLKPSIRSPLTAAFIADLLSDAGLPPGALNLVQGQGTDVGAAIVAHPDIALVGIRGSYGTVQAVSGSVARRGKAVTRSPGVRQTLIVGPDQEVGSAVGTTVRGLRANTAGGPLGVHRLLVHVDALDGFLDRLDTELSTCRPAPLISDAARRRALGDVTAAIADGAVAVIGGATVADDRHHRMGWHMTPTVLRLPAGADHARAYLGPVVTLSTWTSPDELPGATAGTGCVLYSRQLEGGLAGLVGRGELAPGWWNHVMEGE
jgi:acyl-CoA reductase-like NAD-dependent aldehyde dehydrogenase